MKLPEIKKKREANFSLKFKKWLSENPFKINCSFEMKDSRGKKSFPLAEWKEHQRDFSHSMKYSDKGILARTDAVKGQPDYKYYYKEPTFIVINFPKGFSVIEAETLSMYEGKSITFEKSQDISHVSLPY
jgi:hypothetical protein